MFKKAQEKADQRRKTEVQVTDGQQNSQEKGDLNNTAQSACPLPVSQKEILIELRIQALKNLERPMDLVTKQEKKYGYRLSPQSNFYQQYLMVKHFVSSQKKKLQGQTRRGLALFVASTFNKGQTTARNIVHWEKLWVTDNEIPYCKKAKDYDLWINNEDVTMAVRDFARRQGNSKYLLSFIINY